MRPDGKQFQVEFQRLIKFAAPAPKELSDAELDVMIEDLGGNFAAFSAKLDQKLRAAELRSADSQISAYKERLQARSKAISERFRGSVVEVKRAIEQRLSGLQGQPANAYFRMYESMPPEDLPDLLAELEILEEDQKDAPPGE